MNKDMGGSRRVYGPLEPNRVDTLMGLGERRERWPCEHLSGEEETSAYQAPPR